MAKVHIVVSRTNARADTGSTLPIPDAIPAMTTTVSSAAASAVVATMPAVGPTACHVTAINGAVWLNFGAAGAADPVAGEGSGWLLQEGETRSFGVAQGQKLAIADAVL
jgi:hypothetical protein